MSKDDIIVSNLNEGLSSYFGAERVDARQSQNMANALSGNSSFKTRNNLTASGAADYVYNNLTGRLTDPNAMMATMQNVGTNAMNGAQKAAIERQLQLEKRKLEAEQKNLAQETKALEQERIRQLKESVYDNAITNWMLGGNTAGNRVIVGDNAKGNNVSTYTNDNGETLRIAKDTRSIQQQRQDQLTGMAKDYLAGYANQAIDAGIGKVSELGGYAAAKAKYAIEDMKAKREAAKLERQKAELERKSLRQQ